MAYLGVIGTYQKKPTYRIPTRAWTDATRVIRSSTSQRAGFTYTPILGSVPSSNVAGYVRQGAVGVSRMVRIYRRDTGILLGSTYSSASGAFSFQLNGFAGEVFVIAFDDALAPDFNAQIYDRIVPA